MTRFAPSPGLELVSLGCRLNIAESEAIRRSLPEEEDLVVVNSCSVTNEAVRQTRQTIRRLRRARPTARLIVTGCAAETDRAQLAAMPEVDGIIANAAKLDARAWNVPKKRRSPLIAHTRAFIGVQTGCDHACTFCSIPAARGPSRSAGVDSVLREVGEHLEAGAKEVVLTGVDLTSWGQEFETAISLGRLVEAILSQFPQLARLRLSSLDGVEIDPLLIELLTGEARLMPHIHLSLQHGDDLILKRMKRRHNRKQAVRLIEDLLGRRAEISVGADVIAGFPTERETHHQQNLAIIRELRIAHGHIFPFSPRDNTPAARMPQNDRATVKRRAAELREVVADMRNEWLQEQLGTARPILVERDGTGYTPNYAKVRAPAGAEANDIVTVTPTAIEEGILI